MPDHADRRAVSVLDRDDRPAGLAILGTAAAFLVIAGAGLLARGIVERIPRSALQLLVGTLLSSFGTFWAVEGLGVAWPGGDAAILALAGWYVLAAAGYIGRLRRHSGSLVPQNAR